MVPPIGEMSWVASDSAIHGGKMEHRIIAVAACLSLIVGCVDAQETENSEPTIRHFTHKSIAGVSMGGGAAAQIALSQPERWDFIGIMGAPLIDLQGFSRTIRRGWMGGFCSLEYLENMHAQGGDLNTEEAFCGLFTERAMPELIAERTVVPSDWLSEESTPMWEFTSDYNNWWRGPNGGRGASYGRSSLINSVKDILKAYGSPLYEPNPEVSWAAPGVTQEWLALSSQERCANPIVHQGFYNAEYNPQGVHPVITYCDGEKDDDAFSEEAVLARLTPETPRTNSQELFLAVDINRNGMRDFGEPVIHNSAERYDDFGLDGIPSDLEPGYDAEVNPDPVGDDYDPFSNPMGTEGNYWFDEGEPYLDNGLDGVPETGDRGEDSGSFDRAPGWEHATKFDPHALLAGLSPEQLERLTIYMDAGIRDFLNTAIHSNRFFGQLQAMVGRDKAKSFQDFSSLANGDAAFDHFEPNYEKLPQYSYVRYGNVNATQFEIDQGDGNHVGTIDQVVDRAIGTFAIAQNTWPHIDHEVVSNPIGDTRYYGTETYESHTLGSTQEYSYILPPGYLDPENTDKRYPVLFFLHGQGQHHRDQLAYSIFTQSAMVESSKIGVAKWGKFIIIYPNGRCPSGVCSSGNFWTNFSDGQQSLKFYDDFYELVDLVDERYRTMGPQDIVLD